MHTGNMKAATEKLTEVHHILDQKQDEETLDELKGYTTVRMVYLFMCIYKLNSTIHENYYFRYIYQPHQRLQ